jgi:hypothetical protein
MVERGMTAALQPSGPRPVRHQTFHHQLLMHRNEAPSGDVSALVVPTSRDPVTMRHSLRLAHELDRPVVALCSQWSNAAKVRREAEILDAPLIVVEVGKATGLPDFACDTLLASQKRLNRVNDVSVKRNLGLAVARMMRWPHIAFLDDDITQVQPDTIRKVGGLLEDFPVAAMRNFGYPDNSVVCHARREVGLPQDVFVGGGAMAVRADPGTLFFPTIYNEDWLFLVGRRRIERVAVYGRVRQDPYDPYRSPERARSEEFGDCLAEGLFSLWDLDNPRLAADERFWQSFLADRRAMIDDILGRLRRLRQDERGNRIVEALKVARGCCEVIDPAFCVAYLRAWQADLDVWKRFQAGLPEHDDPVAAFAALGLKAYVHRPAP